MKHTVERVDFKSGAKGLLIDIPDASVVLFDFNFRAGDYLSPKQKWDTAHVMEHLVLGANKRYPKSKEFSREYSKNGAYYNASTGTYHMSYVGECAEFEAERIADLLCLAIESPLFLQEEFDAELANVREELKSRRNNHAAELSLISGKAMGMLDLPYTEREKQLNNISLADIEQHYASTHTMPNLRFYIAGAVSAHKAALLERIERLALPQKGERIALPKETMRKVSEPIVIADTAVENVYYRWETALDHVLSEKEDYDIEAVLGTLLGTMHSRIFGAAREAGLAYGIGYGKYRTRDNHVWTIHGQVLPENSEALFTLIARELSDVANGQFTDAEMAEAQAYALGNFQRVYQTAGAVLDAYVERFNFDDATEDFSKVEQRIKSVTANDVITMAQQMLVKTLPWSLSFYGATKTIDADALRKILQAAYR